MSTMIIHFKNGQSLPVSYEVYQAIVKQLEIGSKKFITIENNEKLILTINIEEIVFIN